MNDEYITMDGEECDMMERYEAVFGETPPVAFLHPDVSKRMMLRAFQENRPFDEGDVARETQGDDDPVLMSVWLGKALMPKGQTARRASRKSEATR